MRKLITAALALSLLIGLGTGAASKANMSSPAPDWALVHTDANGDAWVMDYKLTLDDCTAELTRIGAPGFTCEVLPPCEYEDSPMCYWDASTMGNGRGKSFINLE